MSISSSFIEKHGLYGDEQKRQAQEIKLRLDKDDIHFVRMAWADPHGTSRAKAVAVPDFVAALSTGYNINVATTTLDSANARTFSSFTRGGGMGLAEMTGSPNLTIVPDPSTFRLLPWAPGVGWVSRAWGLWSGSRSNGISSASCRISSATRTSARPACAGCRCEPVRPSLAIRITPNPIWT